MKQQFKTNLQCGGCLAAAKPFLDQAIGSGNWIVDLAHKDRLLTVESSDILPEKVVEVMDEAGFDAVVITG